MCVCVILTGALPYLALLLGFLSCTCVAEPTPPPPPQMFVQFFGRRWDDVVRTKHLIYTDFVTDGNNRERPYCEVVDVNQLQRVVEGTPRFAGAWLFAA